MAKKIKRISGILLMGGICAAAIFVVVMFGSSIWSWLDGPAEVERRVEGDLDAVSDGVDDSRESLGRLDEGLGVIRDSAEAIEGGVEGLEGRAAELEDRSIEIEESLGGIREASERARAAIELGYAANRRLEEIIRRLQAESSETGETEEVLENDLVD